MGNTSGILTQQHGSQRRPIGYHSQQLDPVAKGLPPCMRAIAATANLPQHVEKTIVGSLLTLHVPHSVEALLTIFSNHKIQHLSASRLTSCEVLSLSSSNATIVL